MYLIHISKEDQTMSFNAFCSCPACDHFWYECADRNETYTCPKCGHQEIEPEEIDIYSMEDDVL